MSNGLLLTLANSALIQNPVLVTCGRGWSSRINVSLNKGRPGLPKRMNFGGVISDPKNFVAVFWVIFRGKNDDFLEKGGGERSHLSEKFRCRF